MFELVIKNGTIHDGFHTWKGDIGVEDGRISSVSQSLAGRQEIDATGMWVLPGAIDVHTHMSLPFAGSVSADDFFTGTRAAALGGVTTIIDFLSQKGDEGLQASFERRQAEAEGRAVIDWSFHLCVGRFSSNVEADLDWAVQNGLTSMKLFTAYRKAGLMMSDDQLFRAFRILAAKGILPTVHAENGDVIDLLTKECVDRGAIGMDAFPSSRPVFTETEAVRRVIDLATAAGAPVYIVHLSSGDGADVVRQARMRGAAVFAETCPQYLLLDDSRFREPQAHLFSCCPPIRPKGQQEGLWQGLRDGVIHTVGTDHCPFTKQAKNTWNGDFTRLPMGLPGVETMVPLVIDRGLARGMNVNRLIRAVAVEPARLFGLYPQKGAILPGSDADLVVYDPGRTTTITSSMLHMNTDYSIYEGEQTGGWPVAVIARGELIVSHGSFHGREGRGKRIFRNRSSAFACERRC